MAESDKIMTMGEHIQKFKEVYLGYDTLYVSAVERFIKMMVGGAGIPVEECIVATNNSSINTKTNFRNLITREINGGSPLSCTIIGESSISGYSNNYIWNTTNLSIDQCVPVKDITYNKPNKSGSSAIFNDGFKYITINIPNSIGYLPLEEMNWYGDVTAESVIIKENTTTGYVLESFGNNVTGDTSTGFEVDLLSNSNHCFFVWDAPTSSLNGVYVGDLTFNKIYHFELYGYSVPTGSYNAIAYALDPIFTGYTYNMGKYNYFTPEYTVTKISGVNGTNPQMLVSFKNETTLTINKRTTLNLVAYVYPTQPIWKGIVRLGRGVNNMVYRYITVTVPPDVDMAFTVKINVTSGTGNATVLGHSATILAGETTSANFTSTGYMISNLNSIVCNGPVDTSKKSYFTYVQGTW